MAPDADVQSRRDPMTRRPVLGAAAALLALHALTGCGQDESAGTVAAPPVAVARVRVVDVLDRIEAVGELVAPNEAVIAAEVDGRLTDILRDEGSAVAKDEVVLEIDPERRKHELAAAHARLDQARARLRSEEREAGRIRTLHGRGAVSNSQLDAAETALQLAQADLAAEASGLALAEQAFDKASVRAPFDGIVASRHVSIGEYVQPAKPLFDLVSLDPLEVEFHLAERDSGRVRIGQEVGVTVTPYPDEVFPARVDVVSPVIDPTTRTLRVKASLADAKGRLRPGLFARADLGVNTRHGVAVIPEEAVLQRTDGSVVFELLEGSRVARRVVEVAAFRDGLAELAGGLEAGATVVTRGHTSLVDGAVVAVVEVADGDGAAVAPEPVAEARAP